MVCLGLCSPMISRLSVGTAVRYVRYYMNILRNSVGPALDQEQSLERPLLLVSGFIHDVELFMEQHPGGRNMIQKHVGRDGTMAFFGGVYDHSNAAHNVSNRFLSSI